MTARGKGSRVGDDLVEASREMVAFLKGEMEAETYQVTEEELGPGR